MTSYHASNEYGIFHFVMEQPDMTAIIVVITIMIILAGTYLIWEYVPAKHFKG